MRSIDSNDNLRRLAAIGGAGLACAVSAGDPVALEEDDAGEKHEHGRQREGAAEERNAVAVAVMLSNVAQDGRRWRADQEWAAGTVPVWAFSVDIPRGSFNGRRIVAFLPNTTCPNAASDSGAGGGSRLSRPFGPAREVPAPPSARGVIPELLFPLPTHKAELSRRRAGARRVYRCGDEIL